MATRYLIGRGELLTHPIDPPKRKPTKAHPYSLDEARAALIPSIQAAAAQFDALAATACPDDVAVAKITLHPAYIAKSFFPAHLLRTAGLFSVGSKTVRIRPRTDLRKVKPPECDTTQLFIGGPRHSFRTLGQLVAQLIPATPDAVEFAEIESFSAMQSRDRVKVPRQPATDVFEVGLHLLPDRDADVVESAFEALAIHLGFRVHADLRFQAGHMVFLPIEGPANQLEALGDFTLLRVVRPMPALRGFRPHARTSGVSLGFALPNADPWSSEPRVAVLDGGLPDAHVLGRYVRRYERSDPTADDDAEFVDHGLGVSSALLFGPIEPGQTASRPYAFIEHHRVLDAGAHGEDPIELYRTLGHVEAVLLSREYQFINLSLGPDLAVEDDDVHAWTAVIDSLLADGETVMTVAAGNNGEADAALHLNRIQVPGDAVNALCVGSATRTGTPWDRASYSAIGPGRSPGRRKPDVVAFGGSAHEYFHVATEGPKPIAVPQVGTSFAAPYVLRGAVGVRAILGSEVHPLTAKALVVHATESEAHHLVEGVGWGRVPGNLNEIITCADGVARVVYQGELVPGKYLRALVPLPATSLEGKVRMRATFCYACAVDPQDACAYTRAGLDITFRPHFQKRKPKAQYPNSHTFFPAAEFRSEAELRADLGKWETTLHAEQQFRGSTLSQPTFDIHYNARDAGHGTQSGGKIRYALVVTIAAPKHLRLFEDILAAHQILKAIEPVVAVPIRI